MAATKLNLIGNMTQGSDITTPIYNNYESYVNGYNSSSGNSNPITSNILLNSGFLYNSTKHQSLFGFTNQLTCGNNGSLPEGTKYWDYYNRHTLLSNWVNYAAPFEKHYAPFTEDLSGYSSNQIIKYKDLRLVSWPINFYRPQDCLSYDLTTFTSSSYYWKLRFYDSNPNNLQYMSMNIPGYSYPEGNRYNWNNLPSTLCSGALYIGSGTKIAHLLTSFTIKMPYYFYSTGDSVTFNFRFLLINAWLPSCHNKYSSGSTAIYNGTSTPRYTSYGNITASISPNGTTTINISQITSLIQSPILNKSNWSGTGNYNATVVGTFFCYEEDNLFVGYDNTSFQALFCVNSNYQIHSDEHDLMTYVSHNTTTISYLKPIFVCCIISTNSTSYPYVIVPIGFLVITNLTYNINGGETIYCPYPSRAISLYKYNIVNKETNTTSISRYLGANSYFIEPNATKSVVGLSNRITNSNNYLNNMTILALYTTYSY